MDLEKKINELELKLLETQKELFFIKKTVGTMAYWIAQSSASPLSHHETERLILMLDGKDAAND